MDVWIIASLAWAVWIAMLVWAWRKASRVPSGRSRSEAGWSQDSAGDPYLE